MVKAVGGIGGLTDGERARIRGTVRRAHPTALRSPLGEIECVYWDVRTGLDDAPRDRDAQEFWLEDGSGRALIRPEALRVEARASRQEEVMTAAEADYRSISERLRQLKDQLKEVAGDRASELVRERKRLAKLATLLCAIKAHARGRRHLGGTLESQARWIEANASLAEAEDGVQSTELMIGRWETVITDGQQIEVEATFGMEPLPPGVGGGGGYRERPTGMVARPLDDGAVRILGVGAIAPRTSAERRREGEPDADRSRVDEAPERIASSEPVELPKADTSFERTVIATLIVFAFVAVMVWLVRQ